MKKLSILLTLLVLVSMCGCSKSEPSAQIAATTLPVYTFTEQLCQGTGLRVAQLVTEQISCLHDYSLQVRQMRLVESAETVILSGAGLEDFLSDALHSATSVIDASEGVSLLCSTHEHDHTHSHEHDHGSTSQSDFDPHIWLSPANARIMAHNICHGLIDQYPQYADTFQKNLQTLDSQFTQLEAYGSEALAQLRSRNMITFHDGFSYFADAFDLTILEAVEEESGSEASAFEIIHLTELIREHKLPAIFTEINGSASAASIIAAETDIPVFTISTGLSGKNYFDMMYDNINTIKEALQ